MENLLRRAQQIWKDAGIARRGACDSAARKERQVLLSPSSNQRPFESQAQIVTQIATHCRQCSAH